MMTTFKQFIVEWKMFPTEEVRQQYKELTSKMKLVVRHIHELYDGYADVFVGLNDGSESSVATIALIGETFDEHDLQVELVKIALAHEFKTHGFDVMIKEHYIHRQREQDGRELELYLEPVGETAKWFNKYPWFTVSSDRKARKRKR